MPFRVELKRPDLKGHFPCSVCGKGFCHSSSLSRHRMQAHFKSYVCTQCNSEISSNETLRSHMFRVHAISRMFMCRCCNWAFPDKTSLHLHSQNMIRTNEPGNNVPVLARSADVPDHSNQHHDQNNIPSTSPMASFPSLPRANSLPIPKLFPFVNQEMILARLKAAQALNQQQVTQLNPQFLTNWLSNNPLAQQLQNIQLIPPKLEPSDVKYALFRSKMIQDKMSTSSEDMIEINTEDDADFTSTSGNITPNSTSEASVFLKLGEQRTGVIEHTDTLLPVSQKSEPHSPAVSDSHASSDSSGDNKCSQCEMHFAKSLASEERAQTLETKIAELQSVISMLAAQIQQQQRPAQLPMPLPPLPFLNTDAVKMKGIFEHFLQNPALLQTFR